MKRIITLFLTLMLIFSLSLGAFAQRELTKPLWAPNSIIPEEIVPPAAKEEDMLPMSKMGYATLVGSGQKFTSNVDGYSIVIPSDMKIDMSLSDIGVKFSNSHMTLRIFKESFNTPDERNSYLNYSNRFIHNTTDHVLESQLSYESNGYVLNVLQWSRRKLSRVENDQNYYAVVDAYKGNDVYTLFFTSSAPFFTYGGYMFIVDSLETFTPTLPQESAYNIGYRKTGISHMNETTQKAYNELFGEDTKFKMGMFPTDDLGGFNRMEHIEETIDYKFCAFLVYTGVTDRFGIEWNDYIGRVNSYLNSVETNLQYARRTKRAIELTLQTPLLRNTDKNMIYEILDGEYDYFINAYAQMLSEYKDVTVLIRPFNEMNSDWCNYSAFHTSRDASIYVALYKYLHDKFSAVGGDNLIWVWNPNEKSFPGYKWMHEALYYPGDEYVDVYGLTGYNTGTYYPAEIWRSFNQIYAPLYRRAERINEKPMMITEYSCSGIGGDKVAWTQDMFDSLKKYNKIKLGIWWHSLDFDGEVYARPYFIDDPVGMLDVFKNNLRSED